MNPLNSILLEGNLTHDPDFKTLPSDNGVCSFSIATNRFYGRGESMEKETSYFTVEAWNRLGEVCRDTLKKGRGIRVVGRLKQERWTDADGKPRSVVKIVAEHVEFKPVYTPQPQQGSLEVSEEKETVAQ